MEIAIHQQRLSTLEQRLAAHGSGVEEAQGQLQRLLSVFSSRASKKKLGGRLRAPPARKVKRKPEYAKLSTLLSIADQESIPYSSLRDVHVFDRRSSSRRGRTTP